MKCYLSRKRLPPPNSKISMRGEATFSLKDVAADVNAFYSCGMMYPRSWAAWRNQALSFRSVGRGCISFPILLSGSHNYNMYFTKLIPSEDDKMPSTHCVLLTSLVEFSAKYKETLTYWIVNGSFWARWSLLWWAAWWRTWCSMGC